VPGDYVTVLLGAQEGDEASFGRLYELTNPPLVRYLRVVSDTDPADLALTTWTTVLRRLPSCPADENAWMELVVGVARLAVEDARQRETWSHLLDPALHLPSPALADLERDGTADTAGGLAAAAADGSAGAGTLPGRTPGGPDPRLPAAAEDTDDVDRTVAALRSCPPDEADLLALRATASVTREAVCRLTGREPAAVQAALDQALERLGTPLFSLVRALRAPARADELADLPVVLHLFATRGADRPAAAVTTAASVALVGATLQPTSVNLLDGPPATAASPTVSGATAAGTAAHLGWVGATAAAAALAVAGVGAAAWSGLVPDLFGGHGVPRAPSAHGPTVTGSPGDTDNGLARRPGRGARPGTAATQRGSTGSGPAAPGTGAGSGSGSVSLGGIELAVQVVNVADLAPSPTSVSGPAATPRAGAPAAPTPAAPGQPGAPTPPAAQPPSAQPPAVRPPSSTPTRGPRLRPPHAQVRAHHATAKAHAAKAGGTGLGKGHGHGHAYGKGHPKHSTSQGLAKGHGRGHGQG
jgi:DNA-directed RNA polymerase specialized sigma24 family protein